jgi:hypothetical protein
MPVAPATPPPGYMPVKASQVVASALKELNISGPAEAPSAEDGAWVFEKLQRLIDKINASRQLIYAIDFKLFTLIPNHAPHTIGPTGDFVVPYRPVRIPSANFILNANDPTNAVDSPWLHIQDADWWAALPTKSLQSSVVTDLYYNPSAPNGELNFWPICNVANPVRLEMWHSLCVPLTPNQQLSFPQGYWAFIVETLALEIAGSYGQQPSETLVAAQQRTLTAIMGNNAFPPRIRTDNSMPSPIGGWGRPDFDFLTGLNDN